MEEFLENQTDFMHIIHQDCQEVDQNIKNKNVAQIVQILQSKFRSEDFYSLGGKTILMRLKQSCQGMINLMDNTYLSQYFNVNKVNHQGNTVMHQILLNQDNNESEKVALLKTLIKNNLDINLQNKSGNSYLHISCQKDNAECVKVLLQQGGIRTDVKNDSGHSVLSVTCQNGSVNALQVILNSKLGKFRDIAKYKN